MITRVSLRNWKSHMDSEFRFSGGVNAIIGIMGSGKTSIMQAISFALFGTFPALQSRRAGIDDLIMNKPQVMEEAEVGVEFSVGGKVYSVSRTIRRDKGTVKAELRQGRRMLEASAQGVTSEVCRILDMDYELFSKAVYSEQNAIDYFLRIPRGQRMDHIDRMLRLDRFEKAREGAVSLANRMGHERKEKLRMLAGLRKEDLPVRIAGIREELEELGREAGELGERHEEAGKRLAEMEDRLSGMENLEEELNETRKSLEGVSSALDQIEESLKGRPGLPGGVSRKSLEGGMGSLEKELEDIEGEMASLKEGMDSDREMVASLNAEIRITKESLDDINRLGDKCPVCESSITPSKRKELVESRESREQEIRKRVAGIARKIEGSREKLTGLEAGAGEKRKEIENMRDSIKDIDFMEGLERKRVEYGKRKAGLEAREKELSEKVNENGIRNMREMLKKAVREEGELRTRLGSSRQRISDRQEMLSELRKREDLMVKYNQESMLDQELIERMEKFVNVIRLTQDLLRKEFLKSVNSTMGVIWEEVYPYRDFNGIRLAIDKDYLLQLRYDRGWINVEGMASGGERSMAALALRVAFSMAFIPNLKWLILDEPTHNLDENAIEHLTDALRDRMGSFVDQVFLITHDDRVSEGVGGNLYRLERDKDRNEPTRIAGMGDVME